MKLPDADWRESGGIRPLLRVLGAEEGKTRFVGGCVRDSLLGLPVSDVDLATRLQPEEVMKRLNQAGIKAVPTGLAHGTVTAIVGGAPVEVTTLRRDVSTDGRRATVAFTDDWREDAARRDFTMNALSVDPVSSEVYDYFDGLPDLQARRVRFIGDPLQRIAEDHLRILRFFRFHARFGEGEPDRRALEACTARANDLMALSRERIADELFKILALPDPTRTVSLMAELGIFRPVLPEIDEAGTKRLQALVEREGTARVPPEPLRRLSALLPATPELAEATAARLRLSKKAAKRLVSAASRSSGDTVKPQALAYRIGRDEAIDRILLGDEEPEAMRAKIEHLRDWTPPRFQIGGGDLLSMGLCPGPVVAQTLQAIQRDWVERGFPSDQEEVRALARLHVDQALRASQ
jgi:poly(A) polymerase